MLLCCAFNRSCLRCTIVRIHAIYSQHGDWRSRCWCRYLTLFFYLLAPRDWVCFRCLLGYRIFSSLVIHMFLLLLSIQTTCLQVERLRVLFGGRRRCVLDIVLTPLTQPVTVFTRVHLHFYCLCTRSISGVYIRVWLAYLLSNPGKMVVFNCNWCWFCKKQSISCRPEANELTIYFRIASNKNTPGPGIESNLPQSEPVFLPLFTHVYLSLLTYAHLHLSIPACGLQTHDNWGRY